MTPNNLKTIVSGNTISYGQACTFNSDGTYSIWAMRLDPCHALIYYNDAGNNYQGIVSIIVAI